MNENYKSDIGGIELHRNLHVYRLYDLTYSEVKVIDPEIEGKISEEEYGRIEV